jgi:nucleoside phosphorylase
VCLSYKLIDFVGGVVQYDFGKLMQDGKFKRTGSLDKPPTVLLNAVNVLRARHESDENKIVQNIAKVLECKPKMRKRYQSPGPDHDVLFPAEYPHTNTRMKTCKDCDHALGVYREPRDTDSPVVHYGLIGSANEVMKDGTSRDRLRQELGVLCLEMEASGLMDDFSCLVIRGISDYCDSHKNDAWQPYAAAVAAAYAKELLETIVPSLVDSTEEAAKRIKLS